MRQLGIGLSGGRSINPALLFASSEQGVWYDPSDFSTMYQDSAGTTPVTAVEQPVGLILDKSKGLVLGSERYSGGEITLQPSTEVATGQAVSGRWYRVLVPSGCQGNFGPGWNATSSGTGVHYRLADGVGFRIRNFGATPVTFTPTLRELPGNAGKQATATARPIFKATPTRIDYDAVDDALVTTFAASLGTDCTVCRAVPSVGASILTGQTIGTTYTDSTDHCGLIIVNRALTLSETSSVTAYLNTKAGV